MCLWLSLFYYQYSTSGGGVQEESLIFRSERLNFEQSAPPLPSYLIREYLYSTIQYWTVRQRVKPRTGEKQASNTQSGNKAVTGLNIPPQAGTFATSSEKYRFLTMKGFLHKWGIFDAFLEVAIPFQQIGSFFQQVPI